MDTKEFKKCVIEAGADLVGIADLTRLEGIETLPEDLLLGYRRAISIAVRLSNGVIDPIVDRPTPLYFQHYARVNALLDDIALKVGQMVQAIGGKSLPLPASQILDLENWRSYLSHKAVAVAAGVGWQGKSLLVVSPQFGPRIRLVTVLTNLDFTPDAPLENRCGKCSSCAEACPAGAIKNVNTKSHYSDRDEALDFAKCVSKVYNEFRGMPFIEAPICGVCIRACPWGKPKESGSATVTTAGAGPAIA